MICDITWLWCHNVTQCQGIAGHQHQGHVSNIAPTELYCLHDLDLCVGWHTKAILMTDSVLIKSQCLHRFPSWLGASGSGPERLPWLVVRQGTAARPLPAGRRRTLEAVVFPGASAVCLRTPAVAACCSARAVGEWTRLLKRSTSSNLEAITILEPQSNQHHWRFSELQSCTLLVAFIKMQFCIRPFDR